MLQLQRNVPPPETRRQAPHGNQKYPVEGMQVNDFFFVPRKRRESIRSYFSTLGTQHGIKLRSEQIHARKVEGLWTPCEAGERGAVSGVGVWRTE
jgi:hypothetical protein